MSWDAIFFDEVKLGADLAPHVDALFDQQRSSWAAFQEGEAALDQIQTNELVDDGDRIVIQSNAGRRKSTYAKVDEKSVASRPCFLCPENMPTQERGFAFGDLVVLPNPYPILPRHCTIQSLAHTPQRISGRIGMMLDLAHALAPDMLVFYNGPRCGASAPDHFHFQACSAAGVPILDEVGEFDGSGDWHARQSFCRRLLVRVDREARDVQQQIENAFEVLRATSAFSELTAEVEPMVNLIIHYRAGRFTTILFPRAAHRPACYSAEGFKRIAISPATLEMAGILVVADPEHFNRVDAAVARQIYKEVSLDEAAFRGVVERLRGSKSASD